MKITSAVFIKGIISSDQVPIDDKFQIALMGRSNAGKSTLINSLTLRKHLARSSISPGKTIRMDFFLINNKFYLVDFPGYGFSKHTFEKREKLRKMTLWYLKNTEIKNRLVIVIIDAKIGLTAYDIEMLNILRELNINHFIVANKVDKLRMGQKEKQLLKIQNESHNCEVVPYSSKDKKQGINLLRKISAFTD
jgi:GTP-binding protein